MNSMIDIDQCIINAIHRIYCFINSSDYSLIKSAIVDIHGNRVAVMSALATIHYILNTSV